MNAELTPQTENLTILETFQLLNISAGLRCNEDFQRRLEEKIIKSGKGVAYLTVGELILMMYQSKK